MITVSNSHIKLFNIIKIIKSFYIYLDLNVLSWSSANTLAVGLHQHTYLWNADTGATSELMNVAAEPDNYISSVAFVQQGGSHLAIGTATGAVQIWDASASRQIRSLSGHAARVGALAWNEHILVSGSRDNSIIFHDVRIARHVVGKMLSHTQEVCGLAWSPDGSYLASGANDNTICISEKSKMMSMDIAPKHVLSEHMAAVRALAWSPHERNLLASGGGTADRCIKFWNASTGALLNSVDTGSQVCALQWSPYEKELLSSHGYTKNELCLWKYPTMSRMKEMMGHSSRVLHMAVSPDGSTVCTASPDETLKFWKIFGSENKRKDAVDGSSASRLRGPSSLKIR